MNTPLTQLKTITVGVPGMRGPAGPPGDADTLTVLSGELFEFTDPGEDDVIQYKSGKFINRPQTNLVDGGNF